MLHDVMPGTEEHLMEQMRVCVGIDPTADSLHIGHLGVMLFKHFQLRAQNLCVSRWCNRNDW
jgi:tyrosyl-tRNA synthetase